jgi:polyphosphate kinase
VSEVFNYLTGYSEQKKYRKLFVAPINIREKFLRLIRREIKNVKEGGSGRIIFKMNSLVDPTIIAALYEASKRGVKIELIIRGICCLVPRKPGLSDNITVRSIVGRFLEHSRVYYFFNNGEEEVYLSSADMMQRNLDRRVEQTFPVEDKILKEEIIKTVLEMALEDTVKSSILLPTGKFVKNRRIFKQPETNMQEWLMNYSNNRVLSIKKKVK